MEQSIKKGEIYERIRPSEKEKYIQEYTPS